MRPYHDRPYTLNSRDKSNDSPYTYQYRYKKELGIRSKLNVHRYCFINAARALDVVELDLLLANEEARQYINVRDKGKGLTAVHLLAAQGAENVLGRVLDNSRESLLVQTEDGFYPSDLARRNLHTQLADKLVTLEHLEREMKRRQLRVIAGYLEP